MNSVTVSDVTAGWKARSERPGDALISLRRAVISELAAGRPASSDAIAALSGLPEAEVRSQVQRWAKMGGVDLDADGNVTANSGLSLNPTPHRFTVNGQELYAWCSLDTFFLPAYVGATATVESHCAVTGDPIRLTISPDGVESAEPASTHISAIIPGVAEGGYQDGTFRDRW